MYLSRSFGMKLLAVWAVLTGLTGLFSLRFDGLGVVMAALALAAGFLILLGR